MRSNWQPLRFLTSCSMTYNSEPLNETQNDDAEFQSKNLFHFKHDDTRAADSKTTYKEALNLGKKKGKYMIKTNDSHNNYSCRNRSSEGSGNTMGWDNKPDDKLPHEVETKKLTGNNIRELWAKE